MEKSGGSVRSRTIVPSSRWWRRALTALLTVIVTVASLGFAGAAPAAAHEPGEDGCTLVADSGYFFDFHEACDDHDRCYIDRPYGSSSEARARCDGEFFDAMVASCQDRWPKRRQVGRRIVCYGVAAAYYVGVRGLGGFSWGAGTGSMIA